MKRYWRLFEGWVTALRRKPFRNARFKLTVLYFLNTLIVLGVFISILGYVRIQYLRQDLAGNLAPGVELEVLVNDIYMNLQSATAVLAILVLLAMGVLSYIFVRIALQPIRESMEAQRRFISDASHELRTPLATIKTENEVALLDPSSLTKDEAVSIIQSNVDEVNRISTILNNLLNLASFNSATGAPPFSVVDLSQVAKTVFDRMKLLANRKNVILEEPKLSGTFVWGNGTALEEVVSNLLKNAIQYTPEGGKIYLEVHPDQRDKEGKLSVRDTGIGIPEADLPYVFEPFYRSEKSLHMHQQGTGIGLPLVREIVKRHGGSIDVESKSGEGTKVLVAIPLAPKAKIKQLMG